MNPKFGDGITLTNNPTFNAPVGLPVNPYDRPTREVKEVGATLADLPWAPESEPALLSFIGFLLMVVLLIRKKNGTQDAIG